MYLYFVIINTYINYNVKFRQELKFFFLFKHLVSHQCFKIFHIHSHFFKIISDFWYLVFSFYLRIFKHFSCTQKNYLSKLSVECAELKTRLHSTNAQLKLNIFNPLTLFSQGFFGAP